jgi:hypothetical protein
LVTPLNSAGVFMPPLSVPAARNHTGERQRVSMTSVM